MLALETRVLDGGANGRLRARSLAAFPDTYPGTRTGKTGETMAEKTFQRGGRSASFFVSLSRSPPHALEVTGDLDKEERRVGRRGYDLRAGLTGCDGGIDEPPREEGLSLAFPLLSPARPKSCGS
jgi:hypothetical protein